MNTEITENQIADYQENGFLIYDEFLNKKEIMDLKKAVNNASANIINNSLVVSFSSSDFPFHSILAFGVFSFTRELGLWSVTMASVVQS